MAKVLVSYLERKQVFEVPSDIEDDISYRTSKVMKEFTFDTNVNLEVTFQKYDEEWDDYLDVGKDYKVETKDRLSAVITPRLADTSLGGQFPAASTAEVVYYVNYASLIPHLSLSCSGSLQHNTHFKKKRI